jgi:tetratricopeptide (TPR) repeat protein
VTIRIALAQQGSFELHFGDKFRRVDWKEVESLADAADRDYFAGAPALPKLTALGRSLYQWLDGPDGWLRAGPGGADTAVILDLAAPLQAEDLNPETKTLVRKLAHLPWELLHDGKCFLAGRGIQPIRLMQSRTSDAQPANRPLRLLFMATAPEGVGAELGYEAEEAAILEATSTQPIDLVVEESGSVSQLENLVASFEKGYFDVFHMTGHGVIEDGVPKFLTEEEQGGAQFTTAEEIAGAFGRRWPRLLFLSGCHTAEAPDRGMIPSMAHALVDAGADAVLGWARPVYDRTGAFAATELYKSLARGESLPDAVAATHREMLREFLEHPEEPFCSDWHLLRIYQGVRETASLVTPLNTAKRARIRRRPPEEEFLDAERKVKVAAAPAFFGRRRELQRCLKALAYTSDYYGVYLHGIGGYGKSTIAARLCRRHAAQNPGFEQVVLVGPVDEARLRQRLGDKFGGMPEAIEILNQPKTAFKHQLAEFFKIIEGKDRRLLLVLDDFEQNIPPANVEDGTLRLVPDAWNVLEALCFALDESSAASRLIVTCRYHSAKALPENRLFVQPLSRMRSGDVFKKTLTLVKGIPAEQRNADREKKIVEVADGNPRLLEWLMALAPRTDVLDDAFLEQLGAEVDRFRESILAGKLLAALTEPERKALARLTLFQLAVPEAVVIELTAGAPMQNALNLGLLERSDDLYRVSTALEPLLESALNEEEWTEARKSAARKLYEVWWQGLEKPLESRGLEIVRIAVMAGEWELAVPPANGIAWTWIDRGRNLEVVELCHSLLRVFDDHRLLGTIARAETVLGATASAKDHFERALSDWPDPNEAGKAAIMHNFALLEAQRGEIGRALRLCEESLGISERIKDYRGQASTLNQMAGLLAQQGNIDRARQLWRDSLDIQDRIGDLKGKAATLNEMAKEIVQAGDVDQALRLWQQSLDIQGSFQDLRGRAATLNTLAGVIAGQGDVDQALQLWQQALEIVDRVGDAQGKAAILNSMAVSVGPRGELKRAIVLWQQSLAIQERIKDVHGAATSLANMAWAATQTGDDAHANELYRRAARSLGSMRAYPDLITVLKKLTATAKDEREVCGAQAAWLVLRVQATVDLSLRVLRELFDAVPQGDPLEALLAAAAAILVATRAESHPQRETLRETATQMVRIAAGNAGFQTPEASGQWFVDNRLFNRDYVFSRLSTLLEELIGDRWLFDRSPLLEEPTTPEQPPS